MGPNILMNDIGPTVLHIASFLDRFIHHHVPVWTQTARCDLYYCNNICEIGKKIF